MSLLKQVFEDISQKLTEASFEDITNNIVSQVKDKVGSDEPDSKPTGAWISGLLTSLDQRGFPNRFINLMKMGRFAPETKDYRDAQRMEVALNVLADAGLISRSGDGEFTTPARNNTPARDKLSKFKQFVASYVHKNKEAGDLSKQFRNAENQTDNEWLASLPEDKRKLAQIYSELTPKDMALLKKVSSLKKEKRSYTDLVGQAELNGSESVNKLKSLSLINRDNTLNAQLVKDLKTFLGSEGTFTRLRNLNKDIQHSNKRIASDQAYARNELEKKMDMSSSRQTEVSKQIGNVINSMSDAEKNLTLSAYRRQRLPSQAVQSLQKIGILDNAGEFTEKGKAVAAVLNVRKDIDSFSSTSVDNAQEPGFKGERRKERLQDRKRNFSNRTDIDI